MNAINLPILLPGYQIIEEINQSQKALVYRAIYQEDGTPVIIKVMRNDYPTFNEFIQFRNQYIITKNIDFPGIVKPLALESDSNSLALVMPDEGYISLDRQMQQWERKKHPKFLSNFLDIAMQLIEIIFKMHQNRVIHKDIQPQNILIHPQNNRVQLIDFSLASLLPKERQEIVNHNALEGTLAYMSPEQTGRMNKGIDYRSDFYSLGVTLYELLTGELPFNSKEPIELICAHIAQLPIPPSERVKNNGFEIPQIVADIVMKLMAKMPEERYQSALGLRFDLEICQQQWEKTGKIESFELGKRDLSDRFLIPEKLYGRKTEVETLLAAFARTASAQENPLTQSNREIILVAGGSGIGKTGVLKEVHKQLLQQQRYSIEAKFELRGRNMPFDGFFQGFGNLMKHLLGEPKAQLDRWKAKIQEALGENAQVIIDVIPELEKIIGSQPPVVRLSGIAAQNRLKLLFEKFISVFTTIEHPLAIFLEDLQWIDAASLKLIELLMTQTQSRYLLLIGAYRDSDVSARHPLMQTLTKIEKISANLNTLTLAPLKLTDLNQLIADTLSCSTKIALPLTKLVYEKTKGNPFLAHKFLKSLHSNGLIKFNYECGYWQCDIVKIKQASLTDDGVEFLANQLQKLPKKTQKLLQIAACMGNQFDLETLAIVSLQSPLDTAECLWKAIQEEVILPLDRNYNFFNDSLESDRDLDFEDLPSHTNYKFLDDRIRQAAYSLIPKSREQSTHLKIGKLLLKNTSQEDLEERIFDIVDRLNYALKLIRAPYKREELAWLNLAAGKKALASTASDEAVEYFRVGRELLAAHSWDTQYELTLALYEKAAEASYLSGDFQEHDNFTNIVLKRAKTMVDKIKIYETQIQALLEQNQKSKALETGLVVLEELGISFPKKLRLVDIKRGLKKTQSLFKKISIPDLINFPEMSDSHQKAAMQILSKIVFPGDLSVPALWQLFVFKQIELSVKYGNTSSSILAYANYGIILCDLSADIEQGYQFANVALSLLDKFETKALKAKTFALVYGSIYPRKESLVKTLKPLLLGYFCASETEDWESGTICTYTHGYHSFFLGRELTALETELESYIQAIPKIDINGVFYANKIFHQTVLNLIGKSNNTSYLDGKFSGDVEILPLLKKQNYRIPICCIYLNNLILSYLFADYDRSYEYAELAEQYLDAITGTFLRPIFYFYDALVNLALFDRVCPKEQEEVLKKVANNLEEIQKWSDRAPMNCLQKCQLIEAERLRVLKEKLQAIEMYDCAIATARENEYIQEEAIAYELAAKFYWEWSKEKIAKTYLTEAYYCYSRWGALAKIRDLEQHYPDLLMPLKRQTFLYFDASPTSYINSKTYIDKLDLTSTIEVSQDISSEIELEKLLKILMSFSLENTGATRGCLILINEDNLTIEASWTLTPLQVQVLQSLPVKNSEEIPITLINYVARSQETLVLDDAACQGFFTGDPYIFKYQPKSIICIPLMNKTKGIGLLYLENHLTYQTFNKDRLKNICAIAFDTIKLLADILVVLKQKPIPADVSKTAIEVSKELSALKSRFITMASHEFRTPLTVISSSAAILKSFGKKLSEEKKQKHLETIQNYVQHTTRILDDILLINQAESEAILFNPEPLDILNFCGALVEELQLNTSTHTLVFTCQEQNGLTDTYMDRSLLQQIITNLLSNAIKFSSKGDEVNLDLTIKETNVIFQVKDRGIGIPPEDQKHLFETFYRGQNVGTIQGTGLGLSIVEKCVKLHGGNAIVESELGKGTVFTITLPLTQTRTQS